jgi:hypothetical protein
MDVLMNMFKPTSAKTVDEYIAMLSEPRKSEIIELDRFIKKVAPKLKSHFAYNMLGYGSFHYKSKSGREGDWPIIALASQKNYISLYICSVKDDKYIAELYNKKLGKVSVGKSCIRFKKMSDLNLDVLKEAIFESLKYPGFVTS